MNVNLIQLVVLFTVSELISGAPQGYYNYPYSFFGYYPYRRNGYSLKPQQVRVTSQQTVKRQSTNAFNQAYSANLLADANTKFKAQNDSGKSDKTRVSKADVENAKFVGASNQEAEEERTLKLLLRRNRCFPLGRDATTAAVTGKANAPKEQGRFLFDLNVYNVYPGSGSYQNGYGCGGGGLLGGGGGLLSGGLLSDPYPTPAAPLNNWLNLFAPGILQNALAVTARPQIQADVNETDPAVDPGYPSTNPVRPVRPLPVQQPNRIYFDSAGARPVTPAQLIGGVATTVNGLIQQLTGNIQPVYPAYRSYG